MEPLEVDDETDRIYSVDLVGKKNRGNYEASGWHTRTVQYKEENQYLRSLSYRNDVRHEQQTK